MSVQVTQIKGTANIGGDNNILPGVYYTHHNGGRPYKVIINLNNIQVFDNYSENQKLLLSFENTKHIFVGESPKTPTTEFSNGYGDKFLGNSILVRLKDDNYYFIGHSIFKFTTENQIVKYVSEVGNNDVPYPYAIDSKGRYYLMIEDIILEKITDEFKDDPYDRYYRMNLNDVTNISHLTGINNGEKEKYNLTFQTNPRQHYQYDWMKDLHAIKEIEPGEFKEYPLSEDDYVQIMDEIAGKCGYKNLEKTTIYN